MFWVGLILLTRGPEEPLPSEVEILTPPSPGTGGGGGGGGATNDNNTRLRVRGRGEPMRTTFWRESLALCLSHQKIKQLLSLFRSESSKIYTVQILQRKKKNLAWAGVQLSFPPWFLLLNKWNWHELFLSVSIQLFTESAYARKFKKYCISIRMQIN